MFANNSPGGNILRFQFPTDSSFAKTAAPLTKESYVSISDFSIPALRIRFIRFFSTENKMKRTFT